MKKIIKLVSLMTLLASSLSWASDSGEQESIEWEFGLNQYLLNHENPNLRVFGFDYFLVNYNPLTKKQQLIKDEIVKDFEDLFDELINDQNLGPQAFMLIDSFCSDENNQLPCDQKQMHQKGLELEADNMSIHLSSLYTAIDSKNTLDIQESLEDLSKSKYSNNHMILIPEYEQGLRDYLKNHTFPQYDIDNLKQSFADYKGLSDAKISDIEENIEEYQILIFLMGKQMALPLPAYRSLVLACENIEFYELCKVIANTLKEKSNSMLPVFIGYSLELKLLEASSDQNKYIRLKQQYDTLKKGYYCLSSLFNENQGFGYDLDSFHALNDVWREKGELAAFKQMTKINYKQQLALGNKEAVDPDSCFE